VVRHEGAQYKLLYKLLLVGSNREMLEGKLQSEEGTVPESLVEFKSSNVRPVSCPREGGR
jgi:hypothetical protein